MDDRSLFPGKSPRSVSPDKLWPDEVLYRDILPAYRRRQIGSVLCFATFLGMIITLTIVGNDLDAKWGLVAPLTGFLLCFAALIGMVFFMRCPACEEMPTSSQLGRHGASIFVDECPNCGVPLTKRGIERQRGRR